MVELVLIEITTVPAERSRGRHNPRVVKRKMSSFPTKSRAAPAPRHVFRYGEHIRIVAPAGPPEPSVAPPGYVNEPWPTLLTKVGPPSGARFTSGFDGRRGSF